MTLKAAGPDLLKECRTLNGCKTGQAKITKGYKLAAKHVIHTVGPIISSGKVTSEKEDLLAACYRNSLTLAEENKLTSIAFPCISTGVYGYPSELAARVAILTAIDFLERDDQIDLVIFCVFLDRDLSIYEDLLEELVVD